MPRSARAALITLSALLAAYIASIHLVARGPDGYSLLWEGLVTEAIVFGAGSIAVWRGFVDRAARVHAWCIGAAILVWGFGNLNWLVFIRTQADPPFPSVADAGWLLFYPPAIVGVLAAGRSRTQRRSPVVLFDGLIAGLSVAAIGAAIAFAPIARAATGTTSAIVTNLAYPVLDLLLIAVALTLAGLSGWRLQRGQAILIGSLVLFTIADSTYLVRVATDSYVPGTWLDASWIAPLVGLAWSQWTKSSPRSPTGSPIVSPSVVDERPTHGRAVWVPVIFIGIALAVFGRSLVGHVPAIALVALAAALMAAGGRIVATLRELERLAASERRAREDRIVSLAAARDEISQANASLEQRVQDRTRELEQSNLRLMVAAERLHQTNRELQDFAFVASHDLQEPLRKVQAFGDRLEKRFADRLGDDGLDYLHRMQGASLRMSTLIDDLLTFSRVESRSAPSQPVDLTVVATDVVHDLEIGIEECGATVQIGSLPTIEADATQMRQLLQNLIGNALKFRRLDVASRISIEATSFETGTQAGLPRELGPTCRLEIRDNGIGFDEKYLDRIFTVFQRLHGRAEYGGSGIGLAVCRRIVERHHGQITARSIEGKGSTFVVHLPHAQPPGLPE
jgi:signal transduction histidine kinase